MFKFGGISGLIFPRLILDLGSNFLYFLGIARHQFDIGGHGGIYNARFKRENAKKSCIEWNFKALESFSSTMGMMRNRGNVMKFGTKKIFCFGWCVFTTCNV